MSKTPTAAALLNQGKAYLSDRSIHYGHDLNIMYRR